MLGSQSPRNVNLATSLNVLQYVGSDGNSVEPTSHVKLANKALDTSNLVLQDCVHVFWYSYFVTVS